MMNDYFETNKGLWNGWAKLHEDSAFYDVAGFKQGKTSLRHVELEELGDVKGKSMLHLQCHFGLDSMSLARMGARVTAVDLSNEAIVRARSLNDELGLDVRFIQANVLDLSDVLDEHFDLVYTSYGTICWLPDLDRWARIIEESLAPGGAFYMVDFHPLLSMVDDDGEKLAFGYFHRSEPDRHKLKGSYGAPDSNFTHECFEWRHGIGEVVTALVSVGLRINWLHEFPYSAYDCYPFLEKAGPERFIIKKDAPIRARPDDSIDIPHMYSIRAIKPG